MEHIQIYESELRLMELIYQKISRAGNPAQ